MMAQLLTPIEASWLLSLPTRQVVKLAKAGEIPHVLLPGNELRFRERDLSTWIDRHKQPAGEVSTPLDQLDQDEIRKRLAEIDGERKALMYMLRVAKRRSKK